MAHSIQSFTKDQLATVFAAWGVTEPAPGKGKAVWINFPAPANPSLAKVTIAPYKSTYGKRLYQVEFDPALGKA